MLRNEASVLGALRKEDHHSLLLQLLQTTMQRSLVPRDNKARNVVIAAVEQLKE
jgi:hypothetical protein